MARFEFGLPTLGHTMENATLLRWLKQPGDPVTAGEPLVEIETDKVEMVLDCPVSGTLVEVQASEGEVYPIGHLLAVFELE